MQLVGPTCSCYSLTFISSNSYSQLFTRFISIPIWIPVPIQSRLIPDGIDEYNEVVLLTDNAICSTREHDQWRHSTNWTSEHKGVWHSHSEAMVISFSYSRVKRVCIPLKGLCIPISHSHGNSIIPVGIPASCSPLAYYIAVWQKVLPAKSNLYKLHIRNGLAFEVHR